MGELMWQKQTVLDECVVVGERPLANAVIRGLMMFKTEVRNLVAERYEEVIRVVVPRLIECASLAHQPREVVDVLLREVEIFGAITRDIEEVFRRDVCRERNLLEPASCKHRRIDQLLK